MHKMRAEKRRISDSSLAKRGEELNEKKKKKNGKNEWEKETGMLCMDKTRVFAFIAMVINCAVEISRKSERITMVLEAGILACA